MRSNRESVRLTVLRSSNPFLISQNGGGSLLSQELNVNRVVE